MKIKLILLNAWLLLISQMANATQYAITEINFTALARQSLNNQGQIAGYFNGKPAYWENGQIQVLNSLSNIAGINNHGVIVGEVSNAEDWYSSAATWKNGAITVLNPIDREGGYTFGINDNGQVIGLSGKAGDGWTEYVATIWSNGTPTELSAFPSDQFYGVMQDINNAGQVIGNSRFGGSPLLWQNGNYSALTGLNEANAINDLGKVAGVSYSNGNSLAATWANGQVTQLQVGSLEKSRTFDINNQGQIVGQSYYIDLQDFANPVFQSVAAVWIENQFFDLNTLIEPESGWLLTEASSINDNGQIVGYGLIDNRRGVFLLSPVPEPSQYALHLAGLCIMAILSRRKTR